MFSNQRFTSNLSFDKDIKPVIRKPRFSSYCKSLCKESLITGFPVIASTSGLIRKTIKILVFVVSLCGFLYQTSEFLKLYIAYPTMVDIKVENPDVVPLPAITVCNKNRLKRSVYCTEKPNDCDWFDNRTQFCWSNPKYCSPEMSDEEMVLAIPTAKMYKKVTRNTEDLKKYGMRRSDLLGNCTVQTQSGNFPCKNYKSIIAPDESGFPNLCVAIESLWGQPDTKEEQIPVTTEISMTLKMKPEENIIYLDLVMGHILVHDAHSLGNPMYEGIALEAGMTYDLYVNKRITSRLPAPYKTNCTDYLRLWRKNGGQGPLTERACADKCKMEMMIATYGCVGQSISYPNNNSICTDRSLHPSLEVFQKCSQQCSEACEEVSYSLRTEVMLNHHEQCKEDQQCKKRYLKLNFLFNRLEIERFDHEAKYESVAMFSYIGGYMGMWLGISLISLFDFLETLVRLCIYPFRNSKKFKKKSIRRSFDI